MAIPRKIINAKTPSKVTNQNLRLWIK